ncbi:hypothetical protein ANCCEY_03075 [Ancylostoma ceylanicum]|uniref:Sec39 domain-containing protein n=1 Tax=Ancylostoma ceylanicum TaxID=53326 RepID=A0A0D6MBL0_9BILA|nr:hypothetical protein ANCCEY_03075 [Ancylostoma ceylanicum]
MKKPRRRRYESEIDYTKDADENSKILLKEKYEMLKWTDTVEIKTPNLLIPTQIASYVESLPFCKITVAPSADRFALMHHNRQLDVYAIDGQNIVQESSVQVLEDEFAQYCLLEFTASGSLLLSTRSSAQVDVFDHQGGYCYDIPLVPSTRIVFHIKYISGPRPVQAVFIEDEEVGVLFHSGELVRSSLDELKDALYAIQYTDMFTSRTTLVSPCHRELFILATDVSFSQTADGGSDTLREVALQRTSLACRLWIFTLWSSFKNLNERDYSRAKSLAESYNTIDVDIVLKREWRDICKSQTVTVESVDNILRQIHDKDWVIEACSSSDAPCMQVQQALVDLGTSFPSAPLLSQVRLHHNARMLIVCEDVNEYIEVRNLSCLDAAFRFAERLDFVSLDRLIEQNYSLLVPFMLDILSHIPPSVPPNRYEHLLPEKDGKEVQLDKVLNAHLDSLFLLAGEGEEVEEAVRICNTGEHKISTPLNEFANWARNRAELMDSEAGLPEHCVALLSISVQRGYEELEQDLERFSYYKSFVAMCSLVGETFQRFCAASSDHYVSFLKKLPAEELVRHSSAIFSLLKWSTRDSETPDEDLKKAVSSFLLATSQNGVEVLRAFRKERGKIVDKDMAVQCLCNLELTGDGLLRAVHSVGVCPELASALVSFHSRGVKPTFKQLWDSTSDAIYSELIHPDEAVDIVTREMLSDSRIPHDKHVLQLFLTLDKKAPKRTERGRLSLEKSAEVLIGKSEEMMQEASGPGDPVLLQSRSLAEAAREIAPKAAAQQLKLLDTVDLAHELGSTLLPVSIKFAEPYAFLEEIVKLNGNYKQGKKCAKLAVLLGVDTPVATALSLCALSALIEHDERYLGKYIHEVIAKIMDEIYACALLNAPHDKLLETLDLVQNHRAARKRRDHDKPEINDRLVIDPIYARPRTSQHISRPDNDACLILRECSDIPTNEVFFVFSSKRSYTSKELHFLVGYIVDEYVNAVKLFTNANYLRDVIVNIPDRIILSLVDGLLAMPVGTEACEAAAKILLDGNDMRPAANPAVIFALLGKDETNFIDLIASKSLSDELIYLERATLMLEAMPNVDNKLVEAVR